MNIEKLVKPISNEQLTYMIEHGIINGIGINGQNLEDLILSLIENSYKFKKEKSMSLLCDLRQLSYYHDILYTFQLGFYYSNIWLAYKIFYLIDWDIWYRRLGVFIGIILLLNKYGKVSYNN